MGKKKAFVDKKNSVTYNLVYRSTEDADDQPEGMLVEADRLGQIDEDDEYMDRPMSSNRRYPPGHPLAWLEEDDDQAEPMTDARRRELVELGFDDDGYDYLKHMRILGRGQASLADSIALAQQPSSSSSQTTQPLTPEETGLGSSSTKKEAAKDEAAGPSVFVKAKNVMAPQADVALFDASALTVMGAAEQEEAVEGLMGGVTAFSKKKQEARGVDRREIEEIEALMEALEHEDEELNEDNTLLDDFIVAATAQERDATTGAHGGQHLEGEDSEEEWSSGPQSDYSSDDDDNADGHIQNRMGSIAGSRGGKVPAKPGSIASTYWREERSDRKNLLTVVDEQFEQLALEYDEAELDLADLDEDLPDDARGVADVHDFENVLDEFLEKHGVSDSAYESLLPYNAPTVSSTIAAELKAHGMDDSDAGIAILKAKEALLRNEEEERAAANGERPSRRKDDYDIVAMRDPHSKEHWDCESVLSLRSNLDNHPGTITEPPSTKSTQQPGMIRHTGSSNNMKPIRLNKHGIPMGVLGPHRAVGNGEAATNGHHLNTVNEEEADMNNDGNDNNDDIASVEEEEDEEMQPVVILERKKGETAEEKKARKASVKAAKRDARVTKKELKTLYKDEANKAQRRVATAQVQPAVIL